MSESLTPFLIGEVTSDWAQKSTLSTWYQAETSSTSSIAKEQSSDKNLSLFITDYQNAGRGRGANTWLSPQKGTSLMCSWVFPLDKNPQPVLTSLIGLAVYNAFLTTWPAAAWSLKAPNDIYVGRKKLCGILIENLHTTSTGNKLIIGIGANIFAQPALETATHLSQELSSTVTPKIWRQFLDRLLLELTLAIINCESTLGDDQREALLIALNKNTLLLEPYQKVETDGSLVSQTKKTNWSEI